MKRWFVGYIPGFPGAHSQAATLEELSQNTAGIPLGCPPESVPWAGLLFSASARLGE